MFPHISIFLRSLYLLSEIADNDYESPMEVKDLKGDIQEADSEHSKASETRPTVYYWVVLLFAAAIVVFYSGAIFSCRSFLEESNDGTSWRYGFRGFISNVTDDCTDWDTNELVGDYWLGRMQTLLYMGIAGVVLAVALLALWIAHGTAWTTIPTWIFACLLAVFGTLSFITLMGNCSNLPRE